MCFLGGWRYSRNFLLGLRRILNKLLCWSIRWFVLEVLLELVLIYLCDLFLVFNFSRIIVYVVFFFRFYFWNREVCCFIECDWNLCSVKCWSLFFYLILEFRCLGFDGIFLLFDKLYWGSLGLLWENIGLYNWSFRYVCYLFEICFDLFGERRGWCNVILFKFLVEKFLIYCLYFILLFIYYG